MIANKTHKTAGFCLIEVLIASLLFSIILLGFVNYFHALISRHHSFYSRLQAEQVAFQLLDSYPNIASHIVPNEWQYQINSTTYNPQCKMVIITIMLPSKQSIEQKRLICD